VPDELLGTMVRCPTCNGTFEAQANASPPPADAEGRETVQPTGPAGEGEDYRPWEHGAIRRDWESHRGTLIMTLGILSLVIVGCPYVAPIALGLGIAAWVLGRRDLKKMKDNVMDPQGEGYTKAGWVLGIVGTGISSLWTVGCLLYLAFVLTMVSVFQTAPPTAVPTPATPPPGQMPPPPPPVEGPAKPPDGPVE
jgi:hypothetical protein